MTSEIGGKEELYRRLAQTRRLSSAATDPVTMERLRALAGDLEQQLAAADAKEGDALPE